MREDLCKEAFTFGFWNEKDDSDNAFLQRNVDCGINHDMEEDL